MHENNQFLSASYKRSAHEGYQKLQKYLFFEEWRWKCKTKADNVSLLVSALNSINFGDRFMLILLCYAYDFLYI